MKTDAYNGSRLLYLIAIILSISLFSGCEEDYQPKPVGHFRIGLPAKDYQSLQTECPYTFDINTSAIWKNKKQCWGDVLYPGIRANVQITYKAIQNEEHFTKVMKESQDLAYEHAVKADGIGERFYANHEQRVYGIMYKMEGNAATSSQFFVTDSVNHFLRGVLYFYSAPNADSLKPVNDFMQDEMVHLIETLEWKNSSP